MPLATTSDTVIPKYAAAPDNWPRGGSAALFHPTGVDTVPPGVETLLEQGSALVNEDALLTTPPLFGVFDGSTSLERQALGPGRTGGLLAAQIAAQTFTRTGGDLHARAVQANDEIRKAQLRHRIDLQRRHALWSTSAAVIGLHGDRLEYCQTGDAQILLLRDDGSHQVVGPGRDIDRETLRMWQELPPDAGPIHQVLAAQIRKVRLEMNVTYGVLNGEAAALGFLRHGHVDRTGITDALLFTDGLALPRSDLARAQDWATFIALYRRGGLTCLRDHIRHLQRQDPDCRTYPRFKQHDDIAAVALSW